LETHNLSTFGLVSVSLSYVVSRDFTVFTRALFDHAGTPFYRPGRCDF
jgi:hypothetical protein